MKINNLYKSILKTAGMSVTNDGCISMSLVGVSTPVNIKGKRLVLPTQEHLSNPDWTNRIAFHPLSENVLRGETEVLETFRRGINFNLNYYYGIISISLLRLAASNGEHSKLNPGQSEFLSHVKDADDKSIEALTKLIDAMPDNKSFISIYLKKGGTLNGKTVSRLGVVSFPLYEELLTNEEPFGVNIRVKDKKILLGLIEYMIPNVNVPEFYNRGSHCQIAPFLDALMKTVMGVASPINTLLTLFNNMIPDAEEMLIEDEWVPIFDNLGVMLSEIRSIPMQSNDTPAPVQTAPVVPVQQPAQQPVQFASAPAQYSAPVVQQMPQHGHGVPFNIPQTNYYPQQPQMFQQQQPVNTGRGLNFDSVIRSNPMLMQQAQAIVQPMMNTMPMPMQTNQHGFNQQPNTFQQNNSWNNFNRSF